jgi:hypothetical protein
LEAIVGWIIETPSMFPTTGIVHGRAKPIKAVCEPRDNRIRKIDTWLFWRGQGK